MYVLPEDVIKLLLAVLVGGLRVLGQQRHSQVCRPPRRQ